MRRAESDEGREATMVFAKLLPRDANFFKLFDEHGRHIGDGARAFLEMVRHYAEPEVRDNRIAEIGAAEHAADRVTASVHRALHKSFITPLDRDQILRLIDAMDDVLDMLQDTSEVMSLYDLRRVSDDVVQLSEISVRCCERVQHMVGLLPRLRDARVVEDVLKACEEVDELESKADHAMRSAMSRLFREEPDTRELIKLKAVYEHLESISDRCQDVSDIVEGIVLENS